MRNTRVIIFLILLGSMESFPQDYLKIQHEYALGLYKDGKYFDAVTEFKRLLFFDKAGIFKRESRYLIASSYKRGGFYEEAIHYFTENLFDSSDPDSIYSLNVEIIKCNILRRTTSRAISQLNDLESTASDSLKIREINLLKGLAYSFSGDWESASEYFRLSGYSEFINASKSAYEEMYSETKAKIMSAILPGSGQIYTGNYFNGILSLALNAVTLYFTIDAFRSDRIFDGIIIGNFLWLRFYTGGIFNAGKFASENNEAITQKTLKIFQDLGYSLH